MSLVHLAPPWLVALLLALLLAAAVEDGWRMRIANAFPAAILLLAVAAAILAGPRLALWQNFVNFAALLAVGTFLFGARLLGGGDVKLLAASGLWFDFAGAGRMLLLVALAGGMLAILLLSLRPVVRGGGGWAVLQPRGGIPYGIAIAAGVAAAAVLLR